MAYNGTAYPLAADLKQYLYAAGLTDDPVSPTGRYASLDFNVAASAGSVEFERDANRKILASSYTRTFDGTALRNGRLFCGDFISVSAVSFLSVALVVTTDYVLGPANNPGRGVPYNWIDFFRRWESPTPWAQKEQLSITASWGYASTVPAEVWDAMLIGGAGHLFEQLGMKRTRGLKSWAQADVREDFGDKDRMLDYMDRWQTRYDRAVARYFNYTSGMGGPY